MNKYNDEQIKKVYLSRWSIEVFFKLLKSNFKFSNLKENIKKNKNNYNVKTNKSLLIIGIKLILKSIIKGKFN